MVFEIYINGFEIHLLNIFLQIVILRSTSWTFLLQIILPRSISEQLLMCTRWILEELFSRKLFRDLPCKQIQLPYPWNHTNLILFIPNTTENWQMFWAVFFSFIAIWWAIQIWRDIACIGMVNTHRPVFLLCTWKTVCTQKSSKPCPRPEAKNRIL